MEKIQVFGARVHNLKNIDVEIPRNSLTVITGLSGSGKSSLAFDTIFAEGQRRYIETFSAYARNFLGGMERPDVDKITGLSPVISIEQKTTNKNPRSTVGTTTEIYDYMRLLFARAGQAFSYVTGEPMVKYTEEKIIEMIQHDYAGKKILILAPLVKSRKGHYRELFESMRRKGYLHIRIDGEVKELVPGMKVDRYKNHDIEVVIDRLSLPLSPSKERGDSVPSDRLKKSVSIAMKQGDGLIMILDVTKPSLPLEGDGGRLKHFSRRLMCPTTGISYGDPAPNTFSFNSPQGACPRCKGLGYINEIDLDKVIPNRKHSIHDGGIVPLGKYKNQMIFWQISAILADYECDIKTPIEEIPEEALNEILYGTLEPVRIDKELVHTSSDYFVDYDGVIKYLRSAMDDDDDSPASRRKPSLGSEKWAEQFLAECQCPECHGQRLNREALSYKVWDKNISELAAMDLTDLRQWLDQVEEHLDHQQQQIAHEILKEIRKRLSFLLDVGLDYLSLNRQSASLSGGESQRIRLATQIGSQLVNVLYILDEPSIGLHQRDNDRLIRSLKELRDIGNTVIVVEHDRDMMLSADWIVDIGPRAGRKGGEVVFQGTPAEMLKSNTLTAQYLRPTPQPLPDMEGSNQSQELATPLPRREGKGESLRLIGCRGNNLKNIDVEFPLGKLIVVTGVSGSGKSTLINETLYPILSKHFYRSLQAPLPYDSIEGLEHIDKVVNVDQTPIGRTPRSNPATYTGVFSDIRSCEECHGRRYNRETLEVRFKGKSIADVLDMTINQACEFFENVPNILQKIKTIQDVGLGYIKLGQPSTTLSGGESQRIKLATELSKRDTGKTFYILDEPTTGLHFEDIRILMLVLRHLVERGNTVLVIEHNLDVIRQADHIIDIGPEGGRGGGTVLTTGTPQEVANSKKGYTPKYLKEELKR